MLRANDNSRLHGKRLLPALTSLRIFAALHVVLFHCAYYMVRHSVSRQMAATEHSSALFNSSVSIFGQALSNILSAGTWSVSFFFVLSGFILFYNYGDQRSGPFNSGEFWLARFARIYPVYLVGMLVMAPFVFRGWSSSTPDINTHTLVAGGTLSLTLLQSWFWRYATFWNSPGWSMSAEALFYAMFPLLMWPMRKVSSPWKLLAVIVACWAISILKVPIVHALIDHSWAGAKNDPEAFTAVADYNPLARLPEFLAGIALGRLMILRGGPKMRGAGLTALTLLAGLAGLTAAALGKDCPWYISVTGGLTPIFAIVIWNLTVDESVLARLLAWSPLVFLGEASYSVYILHLPLEHWFGYFVRKLSHSPDNLILDVPTYGLLAVYLILMLALCSFTYLFIELPSRDFIRSGFKRRPPAPAAHTEPPMAVTPG